MDCELRNCLESIHHDPDGKAIIKARKAAYRNRTVGQLICVFHWKMIRGNYRTHNTSKLKCESCKQNPWMEVTRKGELICLSCRPGKKVFVQKGYIN